MKRNKLFCIVTAAMALSLAACGTAPASSAAGVSSSQSAQGAGDVYKVGIVQYTSHSSLDEICTALQQELEALSLASTEAGGPAVEVTVKNGQADAATLNDICKLFVADGVDLIIPIATPAATAAAAAVQGTDIPLVYSAVTDPVAAQLADSMDAPGQNMTGTSDYIDTNKILDLALAQNPQLSVLGVLYNLGEPNSVATIEALKPVLEQKEITLVESTVTNAGEVQMAAQNLIAQGAEAFFVPIDNTVADGMAALSSTAIEAKLPVYTAADSMVRDGGLATTGVNYTKLGQQTAQLAMDVLNGADPAVTPVVVLDDGITTVNTTTAAALGIDPEVFDLTGDGYIAVE